MKCPCDLQGTSECNATCELYSQVRYKTYEALGIHQAEERAYEREGRPISRHSFRRGFHAGYERRQPEIDGLLLVIEEQKKREESLLNQEEI